MVQLGTIRGRATITASDNELGKVGYSISVFRPRFVTEGHGYIMGPSEALQTAMQAGGVVLTLEDGETVSVIVTHVSMQEDRADIMVSGPVPGF